MKSFFFAGNDTTAATTSWVYVYLSHNPKVLATLRKEYDDVFGPNTSTEEMKEQILANPKILGQLEYTLAVIREVLRLEPPAQILRKSPRPYQITTMSGFSHVIEKDQLILINIYQVGRNKQVWGDDAAEFKPERFMARSIPTAFMSFSKRPRDCIGTNFAYMEVTCLIKLNTS